MKHIRLKTSAQVALTRAAEIARAEVAANRARRFDPDAYRCERRGGTWVAWGPDGGIYQFSRRNGHIDCCSSSGLGYEMTQDGEAITCSCPDAANHPERHCKHATALLACCNANREEQVARALRQEEQAHDEEEMARKRALREQARRGIAATFGIPVEEVGL